jgi:hypothetical protein
MTSLPISLFCLCTTILAASRVLVIPEHGQKPRLSLFMLAGERIAFDAKHRPHFTDHQVRTSAEATRAGLARWAATAHGQKLIDWFNGNEYTINITEDANEPGLGRAPQPGLATLIAANDHSRMKVYDLILNPGFFKVPDGMNLWPDQPASPADMMAVAWAAEMLHIYFYSQGISLPHHERSDFQEEWQAVARELGMPTVTHNDDDELRAQRRRPTIRMIGGH